MDYAQGGSLAEWTKTLDRILALDFDTVIPGHGAISTKADVVKFREDVETLRNRLVQLVREGKSKSDVTSFLEAEYGWRAKGCPPTPPTPGCLQFQQADAMMAELKDISAR
jgi:glyoxylase-like metal-dependent hydrolase (beta-lactamase superfamily II)